MSTRFFTSDFHLGSSLLIDRGIRPFKTVKMMDDTILNNCNEKAGPEDTIIHIGDLVQYWNDRGSVGNRINPREYIKRINAEFVNVMGNHDIKNKVKSICYTMRTTLGMFKAVSIGHYPSYYPQADGTYHNGDVRLCGHVHDKWKYFIDKKNLVLNINCGVDVWNYQIISEDEIIKFIERIMINHGYNNNINKPVS